MDSPSKNFRASCSEDSLQFGATVERRSGEVRLWNIREITDRIAEAGNHHPKRE